MRRFQARRGGGQWTRNTMENTFGLHCPSCPECHKLLPHSVGSAPPDTCDGCGAVIVWERCALGRCREAFPDPFVFQRGGYTECGKPAVACEVATRWGQCAEHVGVAKLCVKCGDPITEPQLRVEELCAGCADHEEEG